MLVGRTLQLTATVLPTTALNKNVIWSCDSPFVATVNQNGLVTAIGAGPANITVTTVDGGFTATCYVLVTVPVTKITITPATVSIDVGQTYWLSATVEPFNAGNANLVWSSDNPAIATVNQAGIVTARSGGTTRITATASDGSGVFGTCIVNSIHVYTTGVTLNKLHLTLLVGQSERLIATVLPTTATSKDVVWTCDSPFVATVDQTGLVRAIGGGPANITVRTVDGGFTATCYVLVTIPVSSITITPSALSLKAGDSQFLTANVMPFNAGNSNVAWSSSNTNVATVNQAGLVRGVIYGTATITATASDGSGVTGTCAVTVTNDSMPAKPVLPAGLISTDAVEPKITVPARSTDVAAAINTLSGKMPSIKASDLHVDKFGVITVQDYIAKEVAEKLIGIEPDGILTLPVFEAAVSAPGNIAAVAFDIEGVNLMANRPEYVRVLKVISSDHGGFFKYVRNSADFGDKTFTVQSMNNSIFSGDIVPGDKYRLLVMIKDGGSFDLDGKTDGVVFDPLAIIGISPEVARRVHNEALVVDTHNDVMMNAVNATTWLPDGNIAAALPRGSRHLDIPKMVTGGLDVAYFAAYNPGYAQGPARAHRRILALLNALHWNGRMNTATFAVATSSKEVEEFVKGRKVGVPSIEGAYSIEAHNYKGLLQQYYDLGVRMIGLLWSNNNLLGEGVNNRFVDDASTLVRPRVGLTALGKSVIEEMDRLGMVIDVSHMNTETFWGTINAAKGPVMASHSCVRALWDNPAGTVGGERGVPRNLWDDQIIAIAKSNGVVQINFATGFLALSGASLKHIANNVDYIVNLVGVDYAGIGSDYDGTTIPSDMPDASHLYKLTVELVNRGYTKWDIEKILGGNMMRVFKEVEAKAEKPIAGTGIVISPDLSMGDAVTSYTPTFTARVVNNGVAADATKFRVIIDGIEYTPTVSSDVITFQRPQAFPQLSSPENERSMHVITFEGASTTGVITRVARIFYINASVSPSDFTADEAEQTSEVTLKGTELEASEISGNVEGNSGSGCSAYGYLAFALLAVPFVLRKRNK
jgi:membrane dipeptidase